MCVCVCRWICQITNQRLDKDHMCASLCISPTHLPHIPPHVRVKPNQQECEDCRVSSGDIMAGCQTQQQGLGTSFLLVASAMRCQAVDQWHPLQSCSLYEPSNIQYRHRIDVKKKKKKRKKPEIYIISPLQLQIKSASLKVTRDLKWWVVQFVASNRSRLNHFNKPWRMTLPKTRASTSI